MPGSCGETERKEMKDQLWNLFRETGDPMGYLLYRANKAGKKKPAEDRKWKERTERPPARDKQGGGAL